MTVPGQGLSLITPHALLLIFLWRSRFVGALPRDTRLELSFSRNSAGSGRIAVPGWVARNGAPTWGAFAGLSASSRGVKRARTRPGTAMRPAGRFGDKLTQTNRRGRPKREPFYPIFRGIRAGRAGGLNRTAPVALRLGSGQAGAILLDC